MQEDGIDGLEIDTNLCLEYIKERCHLEDLETNGKVFLRRVLENGDVGIWGCWLDLCCSYYYLLHSAIPIEL